MSLRIALISAEDTVPLRHSILRPHQTAADCVYPGDADEESYHIGAFVADDLVCIASFFRQTSDRFEQPYQVRLRGMATAVEHRSQGIATRVLSQGEVLARAEGVKILWCNARTTAAGYYEKLGYTAKGDEFDIAGIGPHYVMFKELRVG